MKTREMKIEQSAAMIYNLIVQRDGDIMMMEMILLLVHFLCLGRLLIGIHSCVFNDDDDPH